MSAIKCNYNAAAVATLRSMPAGQRGMQTKRMHMAKVIAPQAAPFRRGALSPLNPRRSMSLVVAAGAQAPARGVTSTEEILPGSKVRLTVTVPSEMCKAAYRATMKAWNDKIACEGFRKGKAPQDVLIKTLGGQQRVYNSVLGDLIEDVLAEAIQTTPSASRAISDSERIEQKGDELEKAFDPEKDFTFTVVFDTLPELTWTTPYNTLEVTVAAPSSDAADEAKAVAKLRMLQKERGGQMRVVTGRGVQRGDITVIDFNAAIAETGEVIPGAVREGMRLDTDTGDNDFLPGVVDAMVGMNAGETRETTITFPDAEDFAPAMLRGVTANITVKVSEVFEWELPAEDDAWAASVMGPGSSIDDVRTRLLENTKAESQEALEQRIADAFTDAVAAAVSVEIPESLIQEAGQNEYSRELNELISKGVMAYDQAEKLATPQMVAGYIQRKRADIENLQRSALGFSDILQREKLVPSESDIQEELARALESVRSVQGNRKEVNEEGVKGQVVQQLEYQAVMDWLVANCKVNVTPYAA